MKVAILKNRVYKGGVSQVLASMIKVLNQNGITPDILTFRSAITPEVISKNYGEEIKFNVKKIFFDIKVPYEWNFILFNFISRFYCRDYDLLINSNNTSFLAPIKIPTITYIHFPRKNRVVSKLKNLHLPEEGNKNIFDIKTDPFLIADTAYRMNNRFSKNQKLICNSEFTKNNVLKEYSIRKDKLEILYPPVKLTTKTSEFKKQKSKNTVITLGRFSEDKRQLEQIEIARELPEFTFYITGFKGDSDYYQLCENKIKNENIVNVKLLADANFEEITELMKTSEYFLHNVRNEPFGISTVQALSYGCIPMVHDSGGSAEIVKQKIFLFENKEDAIRKLKHLYSEPQITTDFNLEEYNQTNFEIKFNSIFNQYKK